MQVVRADFEACREFLGFQIPVSDLYGRLAPSQKCRAELAKQLWKDFTKRRKYSLWKKIEKIRLAWR